jgi:choline-sulfatase
MPHLPLIAPDAFYDIYAGIDLGQPRLYGKAERARHAWIDELTHSISYDRYFDDAKRREAITAYHGMVSFLDDNIGQLVAALEASGLSSSTRILYTSDHGEMLGNHGIWGKCCMYEESAGIPMILAGEGVPAGKTEDTEVSLLDVYQTVLDGAGLTPSADERSLPGRSLYDIARISDPARVGFSQYHGIGSTGGAFMVRRGKWKYVYYPGMTPQLFDLEADPFEAKDLGTDLAHAPTRAAMEAELRKIVDPERANAQAFADQAARIAEHGGEDAIIARGEFGYTPTPTETPTYERAIQS